MQKGYKTMVITISLMSFLLTCVMFMQFKVVKKTEIAQIEGMREDELEKAATEWKEKYEEVSKKIIETNQKMKEYNETQANNIEARELVAKELTEAKKNFGLTAVTGDGIMITLKDSEEKSYEADDLLDIVNELRDAGAEAISINEERVTNITDIANIATKYIVINSERVSSPYVIKAIGDKTYLKSALMIKNGYYDIKKKGDYDIDIQEKNNIRIDPYHKEISLKYIQQ